MATVLVTGGSGFIGSHTILQLLAAGHEVRTTVRDLGREPEVRALLQRGGAAADAPLAFVAADLMHDTGWAEAAAGCDYVLHIASPFPAGLPKHEDELIRPAREGSLRVLRAARDAGVRRVVLTSSFAAIGYGHPPRQAPFDETLWTNAAASIPPYVKSKTLAERAAWDFIAAEGGALEMAVINPVAVFGPVLGPDYSASIALLRSLLDGAIPACPRLYFGAVDVRDVADLHLRAMTDAAAKNQRFLATAGDCLSVLQMAQMLRARLGEAARRVPTRQLPDWLVRFTALFNAQARHSLPELGKVKHLSNAKARQLLGWAPRSSEEAIAATGNTLLRLGLVKAA